MLTRIISGAALGIITIVSLVAGGWFLYGICFAITLIGMAELYKIIGVQKKLIGIIGYLSAIVYYIGLYFNYQQYAVPVLILSLISIMSVYVLTFPKYKTETVVISYFAVIYIAVMLSYIYETRMMENGIYIVWLIFICSWGNDTFAYFSGVLFGKHKMAPKLSPKKTIEGAIGGILGAAVLGGAYGFIISNKLTGITAPVLTFAMASAIGGLLSIIGDLTASAIKRNYDIKDYGKLIPGHGGILDRYDSVIFTAPVVYWIVYFLNY